MRKTILMAGILALFISHIGFAASIAVSQAGADAGTVMKSTAFTVTVSDLSSSGTVSLTLPQGFSSSESITKTYSEGTTSVSWTTIMADQKLSAQTIRATVTVGVTPSYVDSDTFDVVLPPSFSASASPSSVSASELTGTYHANISFNVQNWGETTAKDVVASISYPSGMSLEAGYSSYESIGTISGGPGGTGESKSVSWKLSTSNSVSGTIQITLTSSNTDSSATTIPVSLSYVSTTTTVTDTGSPGGGPQTTPTTTATTTTIQNKTHEWSRMEKGVSHVVKDFDKEIGIKQITIEVSNPANSVRITVTKLAGQPASITKTITGKVYKYMQINVENLSDSNISSAKISFDIEKSWLNENRLDRNRVYLYRYHENNWERLQTRLMAENERNITYEAETPGFSTFAISADPLPETTTTVSAGTTTTVAITEGEKPATDYKWIIVIVFAIIALAAYIKADYIKRIFSKESRTEHKEKKEKE